MCGRYTREFTWKQVRDFLDVRFPDEMELRPSYNIAPTQPAPVCRLNKAGERELTLMGWGLKPGWKGGAASGSGESGPINARCETAATNPLFRSAYESRRCLVPASAFYEWRKVGKRKQPFYIRLLNDPIFCFAGLWERRRGAGGGGAEDTFTILTTQANELVAGIHDRMPVILRPEDHEAWLKGGKVPQSAFEPFPAEEMEVFPVSPRVNTPKNDDPSLIARVEPGSSEPADEGPLLF